MSRNVEYDQALGDLRKIFSNIEKLPCRIARDTWDNRTVSLTIITANNLLTRMQNTYESKDTDYSENDLPMGNFRESEALGIAPWIGILLRIGDKKRRIGSFVKRATYKVADEGVDDTLVDLANYALLGKVMMEDQFSTEACAYFSADDRKSAATAFMDLAANAICSKIMYENREDNQVYEWYLNPWININECYDILAKIAKAVNSANKVSAAA